MKKILILPFILLSIVSFAQNETMDSTTLDAWARNKDTLPWSHQQILKNAIISLNKRVVSGAGGGISSLNGLTGTTQTFAVGTSGTDFNISSTGTAHTFNIPDAGSSARGLVTTAAQTIAGVKTFSSSVITPEVDGSASASGSLLLQSTTNATKGNINIGSSSFAQFDQNASKFMFNGAASSGDFNIKTVSGHIGLFLKNTTDADKALLVNSASANMHYLQGDGNAAFSISGGQTAVGVTTGAMTGAKLVVAGTSGFPGGAFFKGLTDADIAFGVNNAANSLNEHQFFSNGNVLMAMQGGKVSIGRSTAGTALLHLAAGTATASTAPLKFTSGTNLTTAETGAVEYDGTNLMFTRTGTTRENIVTDVQTLTLTNKRITARVFSEASSSTPAPNGDSYDMHEETALAAAATISAPSGTPTDGQQIVIRIKDNGTARALTWNAIYRAGNQALPTTTTISKTMYCQFIYNSADSKWDFIGYNDNF